MVSANIICLCILWHFMTVLPPINCCQFYPLGEYLRFVRIAENTPVSSQIMQIEVHPRKSLSLQPVDKVEDVDYFRLSEVNDSTVAVVLTRSLEDLVDSQNPQSVLKFRMLCDYEDDEDTVSSYLSVSVYVEDVNDNGPVFVKSPYSAKVDETTSTGSAVFRNILALDNDKPNSANSEVHYAIIAGNEAKKFSLEDSNPAILLLRSPLDYDKGDLRFTLTILASDRGTPQRNSTTSLTVTVMDNDDLPPKFTSSVYTTKVLEFHSLTGKRIHHELNFTPSIHAYDQDRGINATLRYDLVSGNDRHLFHVDSKNGSLFLEKELDVDSISSNLFSLQIQATQVDNPLKFDTAKIEIELIDVNDNQPQFEVEVYNISIVENLPNGFSVLQVVATDQDQGDNGEFAYHLVDPSQAFTIDGKTGWISVRNQVKLDREQKSSFSMRVYAREKLPSVLSRNSDNSDPFVTVEVTLLDANDNNPTFIPTNMYEFSITNELQSGEIFGKVEARDPDLVMNGRVLYSIQKASNTSNENEMFTVDNKSGELSIGKIPIIVGRHTLFIEASDQPLNPTEKRFALAVATINVVNSNISESPQFVGAPYELWVGNDVAVGTSIGQIRIEGVSNTNDVTYDLLHSYHEGVPFAVEEKTGTITVLNNMNKYDRSTYYFDATANDNRKMILSTNITIHVVETEADAILSRSNEPLTLSFRVRENQSGAFVGQLIKRTPTSRSSYQQENRMGKAQRFIIVNEADVQSKFAISQDGTIYTQQPLDREEKSYYQFIVFAESNRKTIRNIYHVNITVEDENDNAPTFDRNWYSGSVTENSVSGTLIKMDGPISVTDKDAGTNAQFVLYLKGNGSELFYIDRKTFQISVKGDVSLDREQKDIYFLRLTARDKGDLSSEVPLTIKIEDVNDNTPRFVQMLVHHKQGVDIYSRNKTAASERMSTINRDSKIPTVQVPETLTVGSPIIRLRAMDDDEGENGTVTYDIRGETYIPKDDTPINSYSTAHFSIHPITGEVTVAHSLPPETNFILNVTATDKGGLEGEVSLQIHVKDVNNNAPVFSKAWYDFSIPEGVYDNHIITRIEATDEDFGENGNITFSMIPKRDSKNELPFRISPDGLLFINGEIDRETQEFYSLRILAEDGGPIAVRRRSTADVDIRISDINDNYPIFYNYDKTIHLSDVTGDNNIINPRRLNNNNNKRKELIPVYQASVLENSGSGVPIVRVYANDSDVSTNGNGMVLFHIPRKRNQKELFTIDSKEGIITTLTSLDYEEEPVRNITILASDLGNPSLTSTALVFVDIIDVQENYEEFSSPIFAHRYYEMEVLENCIVPEKLLALNVSSEYNKRLGNLRFSLVSNEYSHYFNVNARNGTINLIKSPDREQTPVLKTKIRVDKISKKGKNMQLIYPIQGQSLADLAPNEVRLIIQVLDVNDNSPKFTTGGRPLVAAIPNTATYGYPVAQIQATDDDIGINAKIRYEILTKLDDTNRFMVDPSTGQIRAASNFLHDSGNVFGFDVKATDKAGAADGLSTISNVFVFVTDENDKLIMILNEKPDVIEKDLKNITEILSGMTGFDIKVQKTSPHYEKETHNIIATDLHLYAVDMIMNTIVDNEILSQSLKERESEIKLAMEPYYEVMSISSNTVDVEPKKHHNDRMVLSGLEAMTIVLGCVVFLGAFIAAICVACFNRKRSKYKRGTSLFPTVDAADMPFSLYTGTKSVAQLSACRPRSLFNPLSFIEDSTDSYTDGEFHRQRRASYREGHGRDRNNGKSDKCTQHLSRCASSGFLRSSFASLHSSGRDSGIDAHNKEIGLNGRCHCRHTSAFQTNSLIGSYEDSLKSLQLQQQASSSSDSERRNGSMRGLRKSRMGHQHMRRSMSRINITS